MKRTFLQITCFALVQTLVAQGNSFNQDSSTTERVINWSTSIGLSWKSDVMNVFTLNRVEKKWGTGPFATGGAFSGIGLNLGLAVSIDHFGFEYAPSISYGALSYSYSPTQKANRKLTIDHQFNLFWQRKLRYSIGYVIFYDNTSLEYNWNGPQVQDLEYNALSVAVAAPIKDIVQVEFKIMYARSGYPNNPDREAMLYGLRVFHTFHIGKPRRSSSSS